MAQILFVTWDGGGNVPPAVAVAHALQHRGHTVRFLGHASQAEALGAAGFGLVPPVHSRAFSSREVNSPLTMFATFGDRGMGRDLLEEVGRRPADLVVVDCLMAGAMHAARTAGLHYAVLEHLYDGYLRRGVLGGPMGLNLRLRGLRPRVALDAAVARVVTSLPELDPVPTPPANLHQVGPVVAGGAPYSERDPMVLVSLSTYAYPRMRDTLQAVVDATSGLGVRVVATTGPAIDPAEIRTHPDVEVLRYVPHADVMRRASVFVGHGGHGGTMTALAHDLPVLLMPMYDFADQPLVARSVERAGAGLTLSRRSAPGAIRSALEQLLADGPHRRAAARLGTTLRERDAAGAAADLLELTIRNRAARR